MRVRNDPIQEASYQETCTNITYDVAAIETWLEDRSREGYRLVGFRGGCGHFDRDTPPQPCRYRLKPLLKKEKAPDPEWAETYRELG